MSHIILNLLHLLEVDKNRGGKDLKTWVKEVIIPRLEYDDDGKPIMPDVESEIERFSHLHSWYKHWRDEAIKVYPILRVGQEPRGYRDPEFTSENQDKLYWSFVIDYIIDDEYKPYYAKKNLPWGFMHNHYVHLSEYFSSHSSDLYKFHKMALIQEAKEVWESILPYLAH